MSIAYKTCPICQRTCALSVKACKCGLDFAKAAKMLENPLPVDRPPGMESTAKKTTRTEAQKEWYKKQTAIQSTVTPDNDLGLVSFKDRMKKK